jgi:GTP pyrophosphokinase
VVDGGAPRQFSTRGTPPFGRFLERFLREEPARRAALRRIASEVGRVLAPVAPNVVVAGRVKSAVSTWRKMSRYGIDIDDVHDVLGVRAIVVDDGDCHRALAALLARWPGRCGRIRDYVTRPKANGYQSIHVSVMPAADHPFEVQIRTRAMHARGERGDAAHERYKRDLGRIASGAANGNDPPILEPTSSVACESDWTWVL